MIFEYLVVFFAISLAIIASILAFWLWKSLMKYKYYDSLTGLKNGLKFKLNIKKYIRVAQRLNQPLSILIIDINDFGCINSDIGYNLADEILRDISSTMQSLMGRNEELYRQYIHGDEFLIICRSMPITGAVQLAKSMSAAIATKNYLFYDKKLKVSYGASELQDGETLEDLVGRLFDELKKSKVKR
ncbi:GGDEF domain-containing protein [Pedobacter paludis]|uniref:diguanylate cyclase n=1 Tax=Pedobacter paludis TaxID=2203212 RepID=A0A317F394_9SPHI|nr:GGDEF domain-containing protein [Pedobacter paludis]PWS33305.1 hypothetical protein DF947_01380 [Pedobacter paludis]